MEPTQETPPAESPAKPSAPESPVVQFVVRHRQMICGYMVALGVVFGIAAAVVILGPWSQSMPIIYDLIAVALVALTAGIWPMLGPPPPKEEEEAHARLIVLVTGGLTGLAIAIGAVLFAWTWWDDILTWISPTSSAGKNLGHLLIAVLTLGGGLAIMFASLQIARSEERTNVTLRRLMYLYNAVLTTLLLLMIVGLVTVMTAVRVKAPLDFTASGDFTLSPKSINILRNLSVPVEVTFIHGFNEYTMERQVDTLLSNCQNYTDKLTVKEVQPYSELPKFRGLAKSYPGIDAGSLLLIYKRPGSDTEEHRIIPENEMTGMPDPMDRMGGGGGGLKFTGEEALVSALNALAQEKELPVVYLTQGHRELDAADMMTSKTDTACGVFKRRLEQRKTFEVKTLNFDAVNPRVPEKAALVAILNPRVEFSATEVKALRQYMMGGGKMLIMLDAIVGSDKKMVKTGLEEFLMEHGVGLPAERLVTMPVNFPLPPNVVLAMMNEKFIQQNRVVATFADDRFLLMEARPLRPLADKPGGRFLTMPLLLVASFSYPDTDFATDPAKQVQALRADKEAFNKKALELQAMVRKNGPIAVGVAVTEAGNDPHAGIGGPADPKPRMLVLGSGSLAANRYMDERFPESQHFEMLYAAIEWLRGKEGNIAIEAKVNKPFTLGLKSDDEKKRLIFLPPLLIVGCVLALATGVWVVRRR